MDKREALKMLIKHSFWTPETKQAMTIAVSDMPEEGVEKLGRWLAQQQKQVIAKEDELLLELGQLLVQIDQKIAQ